MFTTLYSTVFPFLGAFFGRLVTWATMSVNDFLGYITGDNTLNFQYVNLITGEIERFAAINQGVFSVLFAPVKWFLQFVCSVSGVPLNTPLWAALLLTTFTWVIVFGIVKYIITFIDLVVWG